MRSSIFGALNLSPGQLLKLFGYTIQAEIHAIQPIIEQIQSLLAFDQAHILYQKSVEKATQAASKDRACQRRLTNVDEVVRVLNEIAKLYDEATSMALEALAGIAPYSSQEKNQDALKQVIETYRGFAEKYKKEAADWPTSISAQKKTLQSQVETLKKDSTIFTEKGLKRSCYELQKQAVLLLEPLIESSTGEEAEAWKEERALLQGAIAAFEKEADSSRLTHSGSSLSPEEFKAQEKERKELFFKSDLFLHPEVFLSESAVTNAPFPRVVPLDGQLSKKKGEFVLYTGQFYRFLVQSDSAVPELLIKVYENGEVIHVETIVLPFGSTQGWQSYLKNGMLFTPETTLQSAFGLDLRLSFACDPAHKFSMIIAQKNRDSRYKFSISLTPAKALYECHFVAPPPWQLETLRKPALTTPQPRIDRSPLPRMRVILDGEGEELPSLEAMNFPVLDQLVEELKKDPLALASYVQNEIAFIDLYLHQENGIFQASSIHRNPCTTYLEGQGSPWEQCQLLVYLLRKAGYQAVYAMGDFCSLPKDFAEQMLFTKLPEDQQEARLKYPWVVFFDGNEWISLFPWMKEMHIHEGHDLYSFMPEEYASANRWILRYLTGDEHILKHIGPDGDDTAGVLFVRFVEEELRKQGLSLNDVGIHRTQHKKPFSSWQDFPHPSIQNQAQVFTSLDGIPGLFAMTQIDVCSRQNPQKIHSCTLPIAHLSYGPSSIRFSAHQENPHLFLHLQIAGKDIPTPLELDESDHLIDIKIFCEVMLGTQIFTLGQTFSIAKGTTAALCSHFGGASPKTTSQLYQQFSVETDEKKRLPALLSFVGASYFEKCSRAEKILANLHKVNPMTVFAFGLSKLSPDPSKDAFRGDEDLSRPQVDMFWLHAGLPTTSHPSIWHQELYTARMQCEALVTVDSSSNEHQILREVFKDPYAISTVKLLQLAHQKQQKKGLEGEGFLRFTATSVEAADTSPEAAQSLYFPHLNDINLREVKATASGQWKVLKDLLDPGHPLSAWSCAYMTPGLTLSQDGTYQEMGTLILCPYRQYALISNNNLIFHGGLGSPLPPNYLTSQAIRNWQLVPVGNSYINNYTLQVASDSPPVHTSTSTRSQPGTDRWSSDVRLEHKSFWNQVGDPVDVVTGAFYVDEVDLTLPGSFPIQIRRNYNSQNPLIGDLGCGWKLSLNPFLIEQEGKRLVAELDGTVITYRYNRQTSRWEVFPDDNPDLCNFNEPCTNPFHAYIENDVLYGTDGSKRFFADGLLKKWVNAKGIVLTFFYDNKRLSRIENLSGEFCGLHYNHEGKVSEIYANDGRRVFYDYNAQGDLVQVTLPNTAVITYEYDRMHRVIRETQPHGNVLENIYDDEGRVTEQRSPMGPQQAMCIAATFIYEEGRTTVKDAAEGTTTYKIFEKQIYKVIDPLGYCTLQSWFIDKNSWFDAETEEATAWDQPGGAIRSLKSTTDKRGLTTYYAYDSQGNPAIIGLQGEDLTGNGERVIAKKLAYNDLHLCVEEEVCGQKTLTTYDATFPYLPKRIEKYSQNHLLSYVSWEYNSLGQVVKEDHSGAVTLWEYNDRGLPRQKTQITGTEDPDVITTYAYNPQGQCIEMQSAEGSQKMDYDLMGNQTECRVFSPSGQLLGASYTGYNLNSAPIWKQTANSDNIVYFDYHASGLIKATRRALCPSSSIAYTLYEYDPRGYLVEETDPRGYCTYRDYDALGKVLAETKEGHSTFFSYEPGGLVATITSPSGARTTRHYTTNGLLTVETYPDATTNSMVYDFFGRPIVEINNNIAWNIHYDEVNRRVIRTHLTTQDKEIREFDAFGNVISFTDAAGFTSKKTYDSLHRIKTETTPSGQQTVWDYQDNRVICRSASGETTTTYYEGGRVARSQTTDAEGTLIASCSVYFDAEDDREEWTQGEETTITWKNTFGLPIEVAKGKSSTTYEYDACGNCTLAIDGDERAMVQGFDGLGRLIHKKLPDGSSVEFVYDLDSNLIEYRLPNGNIWKASYDSMRRKCSEELQSGRTLSSQWQFIYEHGYLKEAVDPMQRAHTYLYDPYGRVAQDIVEGGRRVYTYDPRGLLATAAEVGDHEHSLVERSYDADGHLSLESIYLNSQLLQKTEQQWTPSGRSLQIGSHHREFVYQNHQIVQVSTQHVGMSYTYDLRGALESKINPLSATTISYNSSGLPESVFTQLPKGSYHERLEWYPSGKLYAHSAPGRYKRFTYDARGCLRSAGKETYEFDFGSKGTGVRTQAPNWYVPQDGFDDFGKILTSIVDNKALTTEYNLLGQVTSHQQKQLEWDPWGRLVKVVGASFVWEASYDALGRRLQTRYRPDASQGFIATSFYDPEEEFQEIGLQCGEKTFWKIYGPDACEAITDETGECVILMHNCLRQLVGVISQQGLLLSEVLPSAYGPLETHYSMPSDLISYAQSLTWHSKAEDPTGLIWMGARYYDAVSGRFLSPDPVSYPSCLDVYVYAGGDPINYTDPDGRFASYAYQTTKPIIIGALQSGGLTQMIRGCNELSAYCADHGFTRSGPLPLGALDLPNGAIGFINGINNSPKQFLKSAERLHEYAQGNQIYGIYNRTNSVPVDVLECLAGHAGIHTPPVQLLKNKWNQLIATHEPRAKFLEICHSGGADHLKNALLTSPESVRQRIIALAIAPSVIIPKLLCFRSYNYMSRRDFVTYFDFDGMINHRNELHVLEPHANAELWDHEFLSPTFEEPLKEHLKDYINNYGGKR